MVDKLSPIPLYYQIKEDIIAQIESGNLKDGEQIDSEFMLTKKYDVSQITVRKALSELALDGYVYRVRGKGNFVSFKRHQHQMSVRSFAEEMILSASSSDTEILKVQETQNERINKIFDFDPEEKTIKIKRLRIIDDAPAGVQTSYLPSSQIPLDAFDDIDTVKSVYKILERYGKRPARVCETYRAVVINNGDTRDLLKAPFGSSAFFVTRKGYNESNSLFEYTESILLGNKYELVTEIQKRRGDR